MFHLCLETKTPRDIATSLREIANRLEQDGIPPGMMSTVNHGLLFDFELLNTWKPTSSFTEDPE